MILHKATWLDPEPGDGFYHRAKFRTVIAAFGQWVVAR